MGVDRARSEEPSKSGEEEEVVVGEQPGGPALDCQKQQVAMLNVHTHARVLRTVVIFTRRMQRG